ncbi:hypothetical protein [Lewinella sp. 4G2]|uniref:hypothetical protein n=1 Tax=Lewinella sp. 4G2 TaxID=1803372 RepID=UPI0007DFED86|nr:hypothetical protein [Lewinella sp. 4G2]OAV43355.1 hypothetical protein A3850_002075 [Lewinella sp. 4G2]
MRIKTLGALAVLTLCAVPAALLTAVAVVRLSFRERPPVRPSGRTVLLTGGKMTKCLQLARMFHSLGDRVVAVETPDYRYCGTRFSESVAAFHVIPKFSNGDSSAYGRALESIIVEENVDLVVPVASPAAALHDARIKPQLSRYAEVFHFDEDVIEALDDKFAFGEMCRSFGLSAPEAHRFESTEDLLNFSFPEGKRYILKSIKYDPVFRLDLRKLPHPGYRERIAGLPITPNHPWVLQEFVEGREVCTHSTIRDGQLMLYICSDSSPFQVNYDMLDLPNVHAWVETFARKLGGTGQASFDFIIRDDGEVMPIECNPRTHSAITLFHDQPEAALAYWESDSRREKEWRPLSRTQPTFWWYHELHRLWKAEGIEEVEFILNRILSGKEAVFSWEDPLPFFFINHVQIPMLLLRSLIEDRDWTHIDFNIGKIAEVGGD